jgi:hypothetical protein
MLLGAGGGSLLGLLTAPDRADGTAKALAPAQPVAPSTTRRPRSRFAGASSTTSRHRPLATATAALTPATTARPTTTTARPTPTTTRATTTTAPSTTTTTTVGDGTTTSSSGPSTTTST